MALIIDVETTGLPIRGNLPYGENPPYTKLDLYKDARIVQISIMLCNENFEQIELHDFIVRTNGFKIGNSEFHGITDDISASKGIPFSDISSILSTYLKQVSHIIAHNANFDISIIKSELFRLDMQHIIDEIDLKHILCTMKHTKNIVKARNKYGIKEPSLAELYSFVTKTSLNNAHNSKYDVINLHHAIKLLHDSDQLKYNIKMIYTSLSLCNSKDDASIAEIASIAQVAEIASVAQIAEIDFTKLKLVELHKYCKEHNIKGYSKLNKQSIIELLIVKK
jgi:DNA polymerase III epsilon subunit-like protein